MMTLYAVALVVDPEFGELLTSLAARLHTWAVDSPANRAVAQRMWQAVPGEYGIESGVTTFEPNSVNAEEWCISVIDQVDVHHSHHSHDPAYSVLEVYGVELSQKIRERFGYYGFSQFDKTGASFNAKK